MNLLENIIKDYSTNILNKYDNLSNLPCLAKTKNTYFDNIKI